MLQNFFRGKKNHGYFLRKLCFHFLKVLFYFSKSNEFLTFNRNLANLVPTEPSNNVENIFELELKFLWMFGIYKIIMLLFKYLFIFLVLFLCEGIKVDVFRFMNHIYWYLVLILIQFDNLFYRDTKFNPWFDTVIGLYL